MTASTPRPFEGHEPRRITPPTGSAHRAVAPLELFFDLVFVLAIGQLTHHLVEHLTWRGAAETLTMLVAVCGVWAFTTFESPCSTSSERARRRSRSR